MILFMGETVCRAFNFVFIPLFLLLLVFLIFKYSNTFFQPFKASSKSSYQSFKFLVIFAWSLSFTMALLPLSPPLQYIFTDQAIIENNPFFRNIFVSFDSAKNWTERLLTFEPELANASAELVYQIRGATTWSGLQSTLGNISLANLLDPSGFLGYRNFIAMARKLMIYNI